MMNINIPFNPWKKPRKKSGACKKIDPDGRYRYFVSDAPGQSMMTVSSDKTGSKPIVQAEGESACGKVDIHRHGIFPRIGQPHHITCTESKSALE